MSLEEPNFRRLFQRKLAVLAVNALCIKRLAVSFNLNLSFDQIFSIDFARSYQRQNESFVGGVYLLNLKINEQLLEILVVSALLNGRLHVLDVHGLTEHVLHQVQVALSVELIERLGTVAHDGSTSRAQRVVPFLFCSRAFLKEDLAQDLFLFVRLRVVILHVAVVRLVVNS